MRVDHALKLTNSRHGLDPVLANRSHAGDGLRNFRATTPDEKRCGHCGHPVGPWVEYCAQCICDDESECW